MNTINQNQSNHSRLVNIEYSVKLVEKANYLPVIQEDYYEDESHHLLGEFFLRHSTHSYKKARLRGFTTIDLLTVIEYGDVYFKQDMCFYVARRKHLLPYLEKKLVDRLNNMVVVTSLEGDCIITCYKSKDSSTRVKRKGKSLQKKTDTWSSEFGVRS